MDTKIPGARSVADASVEPADGRTGPRHRRRIRSWAVPALLAVAIALAGCGSSGSTASSSGSTASSSAGGSAPQHVHFAKTKFLLHAGLAFGAFHRYIYKPLRSGGFTPISSHKLAIVKAGAAALFAYHEVKIALVDAQSSPLLSKLVSPLTALESKLSSLGHGMHSGQLNAGAINSANSGVGSIASQSASSGATIRDLPTPALG